MKSSRTIRRENYADSLTKLLESNEQAHKVEERYRVMMYLLNKEWSNLISTVDKETMKEFLRDAIYCDRKIRLETEGEQEELKEVLSQEKQIELGYEVGYNEDVKKLNSIP